jgi:hypothetical protein
MKKLLLTLAALSLLATAIAPASARNCYRTCTPDGTYCTYNCY